MFAIISMVIQLIFFFCKKLNQCALGEDTLLLRENTVIGVEDTKLEYSIWSRYSTVSIGFEVVTVFEEDFKNILFENFHFFILSEKNSLFEAKKRKK